MRVRFGVAIVLVLLVPACGGDDEGEGEDVASPPPAAATESKTQVDEGATAAPKFGQGHVVIEGNVPEPVNVLVEVARTPEQQAYGLMFRKSLPPDRGMAFVFKSDESGGFWMKDTLIPLSIAFYDQKGTILKILDMEPCTTTSCPMYDPGVTYRGALEVNQGAFADWGVTEGATVTLHPL